MFYPDDSCRYLKSSEENAFRFRKDGGCLIFKALSNIFNGENIVLCRFGKRVMLGSSVHLTQ